MNINREEEESYAWYQQFWGWFVFAPLIVVVVASIFFVSTAFKHADDVVIDNYYQEGRTINQSFEKDMLAQALGLKGELRFDRATGEVFLQLQSDRTLVETLTLSLSHPASEKYDRHLILKRSNSLFYRGDLERDIDHSWYVRIEPIAADTESNWRLSGRIDFTQGESLLLGQ